MKKARYYVFRDENLTTSPYGVPLKVDSSGVVDLTGKYQFSQVSVNGFRRYLATPTNACLKILELALDEKNRVAGYSISTMGTCFAEGEIFFSRISRKDALEIMKGSFLWEMADKSVAYYDHCGEDLASWSGLA